MIFKDYSNLRVKLNGIALLFFLHEAVTSLDVPLFNMTCHPLDDLGIAIFGGETENDSKPGQTAKMVRFWKAEINQWMVYNIRS